MIRLIKKILSSTKILIGNLKIILNINQHEIEVLKIIKENIDTASLIMIPIDKRIKVFQENKHIIMQKLTEYLQELINQYSEKQEPSEFEEIIDYIHNSMRNGISISDIIVDLPVERNKDMFLNFIVDGIVRNKNFDKYKKEFLLKESLEASKKLGYSEVEKKIYLKLAEINKI